MVFFTDRDLGKQFPACLREAGLAVETHDDHFDPAASDEEWLTEVGRRGWLVLTRDKRIRYKPNERDAVMRAGVGMFVLVGGMPHQQLAENFVATVKRVEAFLRKHHPPFIAKIYRPSMRHVADKRQEPGRVELWLTYDQWLRSH